MKELLLLFLISICLSSCYSFKGFSIPPEANTFGIDPVVNQSANAPATYPIDFSEAMLSKIRKDSRLKLNNENPDLLFKCKITQYEVTSQAPLPNVTSAINRLSITIEVEYISKLDEQQNWQQSFNRFIDFDANANLADVQPRLISEINLLLVDDIFNRAFTNW